MSNIIYSWSFNSKKHRWTLWYIITFSIAIWLIIWWFLSKQYWMSILIMILIWFMFYIENNSNDIVNVEITEMWIKVLDSFYPYSGIASYSIIYSGEFPILLRIKLAKRFWKYSDINIDKNIVENVRTILANFINEDKKEELSFIEKMTILFKI